MECDEPGFRIINFVVAPGHAAGSAFIAHSLI